MIDKRASSRPLNGLLSCWHTCRCCSLCAPIEKREPQFCAPSCCTAKLCSSESYRVGAERISREGERRSERIPWIGSVPVLSAGACIERVEHTPPVSIESCKVDRATQE